MEINNKLVERVIHLADTFCEDEEMFYEVATELIFSIAEDAKKTVKKEKYYLVQWPKSQILMESDRFNECLFVSDIDGHDEVGGSAYMCPVDLYNEIFKQND